MLVWIYASGDDGVMNDQQISVATDPQWGAAGPEIAAACQAAIDAMPAAGGTLYIPLGTYTFSAPVRLRTGVHVEGSGRQATRVIARAGAFVWSGQSLHDVVVEHLRVDCSGGHVFSSPDGSSIYMTSFRHLYLVQSSSNYSVFSHLSVADYDKVIVEDCDLYRSATATVPGWHIVNSAAAANEGIWRDLRVNSAGCTSTPFFWVENTSSANYAYDHVFSNVTGENNPGGLIRALSVRNLRVEHVVDWDTTVPYAADHIYVGKSTAAGAIASKNVVVIGCGRRSGSVGSTKDLGIQPGGVQRVDVISLHTSGVGGALGFTSTDSVNVLNAADTAWAGQPTGIINYLAYGLQIGNNGLYLGGTRLVPVTGSPEGVVVGSPGDICLRTDGGAAATLYVKESGSSTNTGWMVPNKPPDVQAFPVTGTWNKLAGAKAVYVSLIGSGGGGGSGRRGAADTVRCGGGGGGGGAWATATFVASDLPASVAVTVGVGGAGGAAVTTNDTSGNNGQAGASTSFGSFLIARGAGSSAGGGSNSTGAAGAGGIGMTNGTTGGTASGTGGAGGVGGSAAAGGGGGGGGAGGGITATPGANAANNGGAGSVAFAVATTGGGTAGAVGGAGPTAGTPAAGAAVKGLPGPGAGGGAASLTGAGQAGADANTYGGGGGGGGASANNNASGAGGKGGNGYALAITYF